jgi:hypothetical protein
MSCNHSSRFTRRVIAQMIAPRSRHFTFDGGGFFGARLRADPDKAALRAISADDNHRACGVAARLRPDDEEQLAIEELARDVCYASQWVDLGHQLFNIYPFSLIPLRVSFSHNREKGMVHI